MFRIDRYDYELPRELIAQEPAEPRDSSRLLVLDLVENRILEDVFFNLPSYLRRGDLLVLNRSKVIKAKLEGRKQTGGRVKALLVRPVDGSWRVWEAMISAKRPREGLVIDFGFTGAQISKSLGGGRFLLKFDAPINYETLEMHGKMPLPPYIKEYRGDEERYRTVFGDVPGSIAAPTASLHFTERVFSRLGGKGVEIAFVTLHVGPGTFLPVKTEDVREHRMEPEPYEIDEGEAAKINSAIEEGRRIIPVGTTVIRTLESAAHRGRVRPGKGMADVFIYPGYEFKLEYGGFLTNFHLPRSTPLLLVSAFAGREKILEAYRYAIERKFRFYSFGDAMFIIKIK